MRVEAEGGVIASVGPRGLVELLDSGGNVIRAAVADMSLPEPGAGPPDDSPESVLSRRLRAESHPPGVYWSVRMLDPGAYSCIRIRHLGVTVARIVPPGEGYSVEIVHPRRLPLRPREHVTAPADSPAPQGDCPADHSRRDAMKRLGVLTLRYRLFDDAFEVRSVGTNRESLPGPDGARLEFLDAEGRVLRSASAYFRSPMAGLTPSDAASPQAGTGTQTHPVVDSASFTIVDPPDYSCIRFRYAHADGDTVAQVVPR